MSSETNYEAFDEFVEHLRISANELEKALDCLYKPNGIKRGLGYRLRLGKTQSNAMSLLVYEINRKDGQITDGEHEWEPLDHGEDWECVYCELRAKPVTMREDLFFWPDVKRRVPLWGRKWRCNG